jgi:hypothetical protein
MRGPKIRFCTAGDRTHRKGAGQAKRARFGPRPAAGGATGGSSGGAAMRTVPTPAGRYRPIASGDLCRRADISYLEGMIRRSDNRHVYSYATRDTGRGGWRLRV